jgi:hypothetical protein
MILAGPERTPAKIIAHTQDVLGGGIVRARHAKRRSRSEEWPPPSWPVGPIGAGRPASESEQNKQMPRRLIVFGGGRRAGVRDVLEWPAGWPSRACGRRRDNARRPLADMKLQLCCLLLFKFRAL